MEDAGAIRRLRVAGAIAVLSIALLTIVVASFTAWRYTTAPAQTELVNRSGLRRGQSVAVLYRAERLARFPAEVAQLNAAIVKLDRSQIGLMDLSPEHQAFYARFHRLAQVVAAHPRDRRLRNMLEAMGDRMYRIYYDATIAYSDHASDQRVRAFGTTMVGSSIMLLMLGLLYLFVMRPSERVVAKTLQQLEERRYELLHGRERLRSLFEANPNAVIAFTPQGIVTEANTAMERLSGYKSEDLIGKQVTAIISPEFHERTSRQIDLVLEGTAKNYRVEILARDGTNVALDAVMLPIRIGGRSEGVFLIGKDLTREDALMRLDQHDERMRALYRIASSADVASAQIDEALALGAEAFGMEYGFVLQIVNGIATIEHRLAPDAILPLDGSFPSMLIGQRITASPGSVAIDDLTVEPYASELRERGYDWKCAIGTRVMVESASYGLLVFFGKRVRDPHFAQRDRDFIDLMGALIGSALGRLRLQSTLSDMAFHDMLTGLANRALLEEQTRRVLSQADRAHERVAVHYLDLDRFKPVNDEYGHDAGDLVLREAARRFIAVVRAQDMVARIGGDEFVVVQTGVKDDGPIQQLAERLRHSMRDPITLANGATVQVGVSVGVAVFPRDGRDHASLLRAADAAMYREKAVR